MMVLLLFIVMDKANPNISKRLELLIIVVGFLSIIFRSQGIYVFLFGMLIGFLIVGDLRKKIFKITAICIGLYLIYVNVLGGIFQVGKDIGYSLREMVSVPTVQISRVAVYKKDELSKAELDLIEKYIPNFRNYEAKNVQGSSDWIRVGFASNFLIENPKEFLNLWLNLFKKYPTIYFDAFVRLTVGEWYPDLVFEKYYIGQPYFQYDSFKKDSENYLVVPRGNDKFDRLFQINDEDDKHFIFINNKNLINLNILHNFYSNLAYNYKYEKIPVISMLFSTGFIVWIIFLYLTWILYRKKYRMIFPMAFLIGLWLTMNLGPLALFRYTLPLAMSIPILFTDMITDSNSN